MSVLTPEERQAIEARLKAATPGPWEYREHTFDCFGGEYHAHDVVSHAGIDVAEAFSERDGEFIAHAPTDLARLLTALDALQQDFDTLADAIAKFRHTPEDRELWEDEDGTPNVTALANAARDMRDVGEENGRLQVALDAQGEALRRLAMLTLQSPLYRSDTDVRDAVDTGLALARPPRK